MLVTETINSFTIIIFNSNQINRYQLTGVFYYKVIFWLAKWRIDVELILLQTNHIFWDLFNLFVHDSAMLTTSQ